MSQLLLRLIFVGLLAVALWPAQASAVAAKLTVPKHAVLSPEGGVLSGTEEVTAETIDGVSRLTLLLPPMAENVRVRVMGETVVKEEQRDVRVPRQSARAQDVSQLKERLGELHLALEVLDQRLELWQIKPTTPTLEDVVAWDGKKKEIVAELLGEKRKLTKEALELEERLKKMPGDEIEARAYFVTLARNVGAGKVRVEYSYNFRRCGWKARYSFAIAPEREKNTIHVSLFADVWQESGLDWQNTELVLVTGSRGRLAPRSLPSWILEAREKRRSSGDRGEDMVMREEPMAARANFAQDRSHAAPTVDTSGIYARWVLPARSLAEGRSTVLIVEKTWQDKLLWIARPDQKQGQVFLMAQHEIAAGEVWPEGEAVFSVSGQTTGRGNFSARGEKVTLFFGHDPRVNLEVVRDKRKRGESGFLGRDLTWSWAWEYVLTNTHEQPVQVRVERPEPQVVQDQIKVKFEDSPKAERDSKNHVLFWEVEVPKGQKKVIRHALTIVAPESLSFTPVVP